MACATCGCLEEFLFSASRQHSTSTSVLQVNPNENKGTLVVLETVNGEEKGEGRREGSRKKH